MKVSDIMTTNLVATRESTTARELPVINSSIKFVGIVTAVDILRAIRQGKNLDSIRAVDIMTQNPVVVNQDGKDNNAEAILLNGYED
ncbi:MAG: CBS domain-containing protein [Candidatus Nitrosopolaris sp.]